MSYFTKDIYDKKREYAYKNSAEGVSLIAEKISNENNLDFETLLEELQPIGELSHKRHELHSTDRRHFISENVEVLNELGTQYSVEEDLIDKVNKINKKYNLTPKTIRKIDADKPDVDIDSYSEIIEFYGEDIPTEEEEIKSKALDLLYEDWDKEIEEWSNSVREWFYYVNKKYGSNFPSKVPDNEFSINNIFGILMF